VNPRPIFSANPEDVTKVILNGGDPRFKLVENRNFKNGRRAWHEYCCSRN
jgi:hypothetical protein